MDKSLASQPYSFRITALCTDIKAIQKYHVSKRILLGFSKVNQPLYIKKQIEENEKMKLKICYKSLGISAMDVE